MFVKYIQQETGTRVQIKGLGSGYIETDTGRESDEPMHINVACVVSSVNSRTRLHVSPDTDK